MDTRAAASKANVTVATIRTWCRRNVIAATKTAGRHWDVDETSLAHRITLNPKAAPVTVTNDTWGHALGIHGPADLLAAAFDTQQSITITAGPYAGETVRVGIAPYLGAPREGLDHAGADGTAVYLIDTGMLYDGAPTLLDAYEQHLAGGALVLAAANNDERTYSNPRYL